jgi:hypothetical protein
VQIDRDALSRHYGSLSDEELLALDREDLTDTAQEFYDREMEKRQLDAAEEEPRNEPISLEAEGEADPDWLESASCACSFQAGAGNSPYADEAQRACEILRDAGVPSQVVAEHSETGPDLLNVMVPGPLHLKAASLLDRDLFNEEMEETWRTHFAELSDDELGALDPDILCAGILDRAERLKRIFQEEKERRGQPAGA